MRRLTPLALVTLFLAASPAYPAQPTTAPYLTAHDAPLRPTERLVSKTDKYAQFRVEFDGVVRGHRVPAFLYVPADNVPKRPAILLHYGSGGNKNTNYIVILGQQFVQRGYAVLTIDAPGRGERKDRAPGARLPMGIAANFDDRWLETLGDFSRAVDYLASRPDIDPNRLAFVGISWGAITGITFVAYDPRIKVMASVVGGGSFLGWLPPFVAADARKTIETLDPIYHIAAIAPRPLLLLNVNRDQLVPRFFSEPLHNAAGANATKMWLDTDHFFSTVDRYKVGHLVLDFVEKNLPKP